MKHFRGFMLEQRTCLRSILLLLAALSISACDLNGFNVTTSFSKTKKVEEGTLVYFDHKEIGKVSDVELLDDRVNLILSLDKTEAITIGSGAAVFLDYQKGVQVLEFYDRTNAENSKLEDGQTVVGIDSIFQLGAWIVGGSIQQGSSKVTEFIESFDGYLQSDEFDTDKEIIRDQVDSATEAAKNAAQNIEGELQKIVKELERATQSTKGYSD